MQYLYVFINTHFVCSLSNLKRWENLRLDVAVASSVVLEVLWQFEENN